MHLISIIMNCYNGEKYLHDSISSVINQKYKFWELIFWDNQSNDNSKEIFLNFNDDRLKYFYAKEFTNLSQARNLAIDKSIGELITFLDVDDVWDDNKLLHQQRLYAENGTKIIYSNYRILNERNNITSIYSKSRLPEGYISNYLLKNYCVGLVTLMIESGIFKKEKYFFSSKYSVIGDFDLVFRLSQKYKIACYQSPICTLRKHLSNDSLISLPKQINELELWKTENQLDSLFNKKIIHIDNKINYLKFINLILNNKRINSMKYIFFQKNYLIKFKMILIFFFIRKNYFLKFSKS